MEELRKILIEIGSDTCWGGLMDKTAEDTQKLSLIRVGNQIQFNAQFLDRETWVFDYAKANFTVDEFRQAVETLKKEGSSILMGEGHESGSMKRNEDGTIEVVIHQIGAMCKIRTSLESLELEY